MTAKESLSRALDAFATESQNLSAMLRSADLFPVPVHLLQKPPAARKHTKGLIMENINTLTQALDQLEAIHESLIAGISRLRAPLFLAIAPVGALPLELIQHIIQFATESPRDRAQIIHLSHVSRTWRTAVLGVSKLFVSPNWARWSRETVDEWCLRAGTHHLDAFVRNDDLPGENRSETFRQTCLPILPYMARVGTLRVELAGERDPGLILALSELFDQPMPCLRHLTLISVSTSGVNHPSLFAKHLPLLTTLIIAGLNPSIQGSINQLRNLSWEIADPEERQCLADFLQQQASITHLTITEWDYSAVGGSDEAVPALLLPSATSLELRRFRPESAQSLGRLLSLMLAPQLRSLELVINYKTLHDTAFRALPATISSHIESLIVILQEPTHVQDVMEPLIQTHAGAMVFFPNLREIVIQTITGDPQPVDEGMADLLKDFAKMRKGKLQLLVLPTLPGPALMDALRTQGLLEIRDHYVLDDHDL